MVPHSLRSWFLLHFVADIIFAVPLIFAPLWFLGIWGLENTDTLTARLTGAALAGIGGNSLLMHKGGVEEFTAMLNLKIIWSLTAIIAIIMTISDGGPLSLYIFLLIFSSFSGIWIYYRIRLSGIRKAP